MPKIVYVLRGLPGSGKSTFAQKRWPGLTPAQFAPAKWSPISVSADHYFTNLATGEYSFGVAKLAEAHGRAYKRLGQAMVDGVEEIVVDNTHTTRQEYSTVEALAAEHGYEVKIIDLFDGGLSNEALAERNVHQVPLKNIEKFRARWEEDERAERV